ncbi:MULTISPECIES: IucA/IucC family protein [unclassified Paraburkholderia]|uniref:IucA/IucC family protein n=1 Tax=unclassified Paraburkholderia TaxID=2615204 RepID=UPI002AB1A51C|nr:MULTISPECIES: IucA/IucC family protein [unclassified Paraburkholderia]
MKSNLSILQTNHAFYAERRQDAEDAARRNAVRRLVRCLFAEGILDARALEFSADGCGASLALANRNARLLFTDLETAPANTFINNGELVLADADGTRTTINQPDRLIDALRPSFDFKPGDDGVAGLKADIANSIANDALARIYRDAWNADLRERIRVAGSGGLLGYMRKHLSVRQAAVELDQWGSLEGHPFYPTWKSKPDLDAEEVAALSPEFNALVNVRVAALRRDMAYIERMPHVESVQTWFAANFPNVWTRWRDGLNEQGLDEHDWLPLPIHSWHLEHFVRHEYAAELEEGILLLEGPDIETWPTMSFRTMMPRLPGPVPFIKLPVALWLTSEQRTLQAKSIHMGPRISWLMKRILADERGFDGTLEAFPEEAAFHYRHAAHQEDRPGRHLSVAFRASAEALDRTDALLPVTVAALFTASPVDGRPLVTELVEMQSGTPAATSTVGTWFRNYVRAVVHPVIGIYLLYGIALEAHQQNTSVLFDEIGMPRKMLIRDFGDGRTYAPLLNARGYELKPYAHPGILPTVFDQDIEPVRDFVLDACFVCHLHELALALTREYALTSDQLWRVIREETARAFDAFSSRVEPTLWARELDAFLEQPWPTRSVLRMHLLKYADYRLQHDLPNPLPELVEEQ